MSSYTPGPWEAKGENGRYFSKHKWNAQHAYKSSQYVPVHVGGYVIALVVDADFDDESHEANARLISAAPDLLDALKGVLRVADRNTDEFNAARSAIAKATGVTP